MLRIKVYSSALARCRVGSYVNYNLKSYLWTKVASSFNLAIKVCFLIFDYWSSIVWYKHQSCHVYITYIEIFIVHMQGRMFIIRSS